jgi:hypothetical protein
MAKIRVSSRMVAARISAYAVPMFSGREGGNPNPAGQGAESMESQRFFMHFLFVFCGKHVIK